MSCSRTFNRNQNQNFNCDINRNNNGNKGRYRKSRYSEDLEIGRRFVFRRARTRASASSRKPDQGGRDSAMVLAVVLPPPCEGTGGA